jgi:HPt (histidine-containing phosphotransfer) domain-containing protein
MSLEIFSPFIDVDKALDRLVDDEVLFMDVLGMLLDEFKNEKARFAGLIENRLSKEVGELAHYFKGIAANLSIFNVQALAQIIQQKCVAEDWLSVDDTFNQLCSEMDSISLLYDKVKSH